jgi:hypothetical protein
MSVFFRSCTIMSLILLSGCGIADHFQAESRMDSAQDAYTKCLTANPQLPATCDPLKAVYEQDRAAFEGK